MEADFAGGMTEHRGVLDAGGQEGYHARRRAAAGELNTQRISSADFADDMHRRAAARLVRGLALWLLPTAVLLVFNVRRTRHACLGMRQIRQQTTSYERYDGMDIGMATGTGVPLLAHATTVWML